MKLHLNSNYYSFQLGSVSGNLRSFETYVPTLLTVSPTPPASSFHYLLPTTFSSFPLTSFSFLMLASIMNKFTGTARNILLLNIPCGKVSSKLLISDRCLLRDAKLPNSALPFLPSFAICEWKWRWKDDNLCLYSTNLVSVLIILIPIQAAGSLRIPCALAPTSQQK